MANVTKHAIFFSAACSPLALFVCPATTPWFEAYRENFLQSMPSSDHEFLNHYLACILDIYCYRLKKIKYKFNYFLSRCQLSFLDCFRSGLLVVSSSEAVPVEQFVKLSQEQHRIQHSGDYSKPKWFIPNTLKYYVLLHDVSQGDEQR